MYGDDAAEDFFMAAIAYAEQSPARDTIESLYKNEPESLLNAKYGICEQVSQVPEHALKELAQGFERDLKDTQTFRHLDAIALADVARELVFGAYRSGC